MAEDDRYVKTTLLIYPRQLIRLDRLSTDIREKTGATVHRAKLIRGVLDAVEDAKIDLTTCHSEAEIKNSRQGSSFKR